MAGQLSEVRALLDVVQARLNAAPADRDDWAVISRQLRAAARLAERAATDAAQAPEHPTTEAGIDDVPAEDYPGQRIDGPDDAYEPRDLCREAPRRKSLCQCHCTRDAGHDGRHYCGDCGWSWGRGKEPTDAEKLAARI